MADAARNRRRTPAKVSSRSVSGSGNAVMRAARAAATKHQDGLPLIWCTRDQALKLYRAGVIERMTLVKTGVPSRYIRVLSTLMKLPVEKLYRTLGLVRPTVDRKMRMSRRLNPDESERVLGFARLIGQAQSLVEESGSVKRFDAAAWMSDWLDQPIPALGGKTPAEFMDTVDGRGLISDLLSQQQSGAYA
jgi:putative toxin-antitoxin system antitoxin component (TIGR02293 family)